jgi:hypothetical protein
MTLAEVDGVRQQQGPGGGDLRRPAPLARPEVVGAGQPDGARLVGDDGGPGRVARQLADLGAVLPDCHQHDALAGVVGGDLGKGFELGEVGASSSMSSSRG